VGAVLSIYRSEREQRIRVRIMRNAGRQVDNA
jgi:hypothetical protein